MSAFAQSESESISANVRWGKRQAMKEGKASVNFKKLYGFYLDDEGNPQVNSDQAEAVRSIFDQYLQSQFKNDQAEFGRKGGAESDGRSKVGYFPDQKHPGKRKILW